MTKELDTGAIHDALSKCLGRVRVLSLALSADGADDALADFANDLHNDLFAIVEQFDRALLREREAQP
jgi:hypothetical protein